MNFITSRLPAIKFIGTAALLHYGFTIYSDVFNIDRSDCPTERSNDPRLHPVKYKIKTLIQYNWCAKTKINQISDRIK